MKTLTILVAEDDLLTRMTLERSVVQWGYQLVSAADGENARELLRTRTIDVCLLDWDLPKLNGIELCQWLRTQTTAQAPYVVLITGNEQREEIQRTITSQGRVILGICVGELPPWPISSTGRNCGWIKPRSRARSSAAWRA